MGFVRDHQRPVRIVFIVCLILLAFGRMGFAQPILFVIGYMDAALLVFLVWIIYQLVKTFISTR
jgi:hypothetical protein